MNLIKYGLGMFLGVFITMIFIYVIKKMAAKYPIPVVSEVAAEV
jgi:hypothetical protein